jgi:hypothetical protein
MHELNYQAQEVGERLALVWSENFSYPVNPLGINIPYPFTSSHCLVPYMIPPSTSKSSSISFASTPKHQDPASLTSAFSEGFSHGSLFTTPQNFRRLKKRGCHAVSFDSVDCLCAFSSNFIRTRSRLGQWRGRGLGRRLGICISRG